MKRAQGQQHKHVIHIGHKAQKMKYKQSTNIKQYKAANLKVNGQNIVSSVMTCSFVIFWCFARFKHAPKADFLMALLLKESGKWREVRPVQL